jgi:O-Antigen ligase
MKTTQMIEPRLAVRFVIPALACVAALILGRFLVASENPWTALLFVVEIVLAATAVVNPRLGIYLFVAAAGYSDLLKRLGIVFGPVQGEDIVVALASAPLLFGATAVGTLFYQVIFARSKLTKAQWIMLCICAAIAVINALKARNAGGFAASAQLFIGSSLYYLLVPLIGILFKELADLQRLLRFSAYIFAPVALYGIWQTLFGFAQFERDYLSTGLTMMIAELYDAHPRPFSTLASPHPFGVCMAMLACACTFVPLRGQRKQIWEYLFALLFVAGCIASFVRAAWFILIFAAIGWLCYPRKIFTILYYATLVTLFALLFANADVVMERLDTAQKLLPTETSREKEAFDLGTFGTRLWSFRNAVQNPAFHTWFGNPQIEKDFQTVEANMEEAAHDQLTQILASYGFVGLGVFASIFVGLLAVMHSLIFRMRSGFTRTMTVGLVATTSSIVFSGMVFGSHLNVFPVNALISLLVGTLFALLLNVRPARKTVSVLSQEPEAARDALLGSARMRP